jgi:TATA-box binding protein (TBP) (component of TFIID and TFIIIB)
MIFNSGKLIVLGSESEKDAHLGAKKIAKDISKALSIKCKLIEFRVTNLVAYSDVGF